MCLQKNAQKLGVLRIIGQERGDKGDIYVDKNLF
jgi:hypothetical protein